MTYEEYSKKRNALGLTDYAVSALTRISRATLSQWKNGNTSPSHNTCQRLNYLFNNYDPRESYPENYFVMGSPAIEPFTPANEFPSTAKGTKRFPPNIKDEPPLRIDGYYINILGGKPVELSESEYAELKKTTEAFALAWLQSHGIIK